MKLKYLIINLLLLFFLPFIGVAKEGLLLSIEQEINNNFIITHNISDNRIQPKIVKNNNVFIISYPKDFSIKLDSVSREFLLITNKISLLPEKNALKIVIKEKLNNISLKLDNQNRILFEKIENYTAGHRLDHNNFVSSFSPTKVKSITSSVATGQENMTIIKEGKSEKWIFNFTDKVAAAFFKRGGYIWLVFNKYKNYTQQDFEKSGLEISNFKQIKNDNYTILTFKSSKNISLKASSDNTKWTVDFLDGKDSFSAFPDHPIWQYNSPYSKGIFFPLEEKDKEVIKVLDPLIGDDIYILTTYQSGAGVPFARKFVDFNLLVSAQGLVVLKNYPNINVNLLKQGVEFLVPETNFSRASTKGLIKSQNEINDQQNLSTSLLKTRKVKSILTLKKLEPSQFNKGLKKIYSSISKSKLADKGILYYELLSFLFSNSLYYESASLASMMNKKDPLIKDKLLNMAMIETISNFMINRADKSLLALNSIDFSNYPSLQKDEIEFWIRVINVMLGKSNNSINYLQYQDSFLANYPNDIKRKILIDNIEASFDNKNNKEVSSLLLALEGLSKGDNQLNDLTYYQGKLAAYSGEVKKSLEIWNELSQQIDDQRNRVRATIDETMLNYNNKLIDINQAINRLNSVTIAWRGDEIEADLLKNLGDLYLIKGDYLDSLRVWNSLLNNYYNREDYMYLTSSMSKILNDVFVGGYASQVSDVDAVIIYFKYENLIPVGEMGDKIAVALADRLYRLDLIDLAEKILLHQINYRVGEKEKVILAIKLAEIYYNNRDYSKSIDILKKYPNLDNKEDEAQRNLLMAENLFYLGDYDTSMELLKNNFSPRANDVKSLIFQQKEDWLNLKRVLLVSLNRKKDYDSLNSNELFDLQRLAIALFKLGDEKTLIEYYNKFKDEVPDINETKALYNFLIRAFEEEKMSDGQRFSAKQIQNVEEFFKNYSKSFISPRV